MTVALFRRSSSYANGTTVNWIAIILVIGLGGAYGFPNGMIPIFGAKLPAIATAAMTGIVMNLLLSIGRKKNA